MVKKTKKALERSVEIPQDVTVSFADSVLTVKGPKGEVSRLVTSKIILIKIEEGKVEVAPKKKNTKKEKAIINTVESHIKNMVQGVQEHFVYKLKVCASHFPMTVKVNGKNLEVSNFLGEKITRKLSLKEGATVKVEGDIIEVDSADKELAGQVAADIEYLMRRPAFDRRIFQDGIYMIEKAGVALK